MSHRAWAYIWGVLLAGLAISVLAFNGLDQAMYQWPTFVALTVLATLAQLFKAEAPNHQLYYATLVFLFAGLLLLHPFLFVLLVTISYLVEWMKERLINSPHLRAWYLQPFNIAVHIIAGFVARWVYTNLDIGFSMLVDLSMVLAVGIAALSYTVLNHVLVGLALLLARGVSWRESGILDLENLVLDFIQLCLGYVVAVLWSLNPWLILPALSPLVLIYRALMIPQLKKEAQTDEKTGLYNARHCAKLFQMEFERAKRFERPLSCIMADLDLLRNINNTYGHLAGDVVLAGVGQIIRETIREYDIAGRFGGEEFVIALPEVGPIEAKTIAARIRQAVEAADFVVTTSPTPIHATISLGVASFPMDATSPADLIHQADVAVYQAKLQGRNRVVCASDVPHFVKLEVPHVEDRLASPYAAVFVPRPGHVDESRSIGKSSTGDSATSPQASPPVTPVVGCSPVTSPTVNISKIGFWLFVGGVIVAGVALTIWGFTLSPQVDLGIIVLLTIMAAITELLQLELYGDGSVSVSVSIVFASAVIAGIPGVAFVSIAIALAHSARRRPPIYKTAFNWATHVVAGWAPMLAKGSLTLPLQIQNLPLLGISAGVAALVYYVIDTGLIATAIALSERQKPISVWRERYQWLADHYVVLCILGLFLSIAYTALGLAGVIVFMLPVFMMRYVQKQYVERTEDSIRELKRMNRELTQANREVIRASQAIRQLNDELFLAFAKIIDARDPYVSGHTSKVADYATATAMELGLPAEVVARVRQAAYLHDIGKIAIPEQVLNKPGKLTREEYEFVKTHAVLGAEFLETCRGLRHLAPMIKYHHERWDGHGYPDGLHGEQMPLEARILAVCDAVEAMASDRPYRPAMPLHLIIAELKRCAGTQFAPAVVDAFIRVAEREGERFIINSAREVVRKYAKEGAAEARPVPVRMDVKRYSSFGEYGIPVLV